MSKQSRRKLELVGSPRTTGVHFRARASRDTRRIVLVVEDSYALRKLVVAALRGAGFDVLDVTTIAEALFEVRANPVGLVLLDRHLPDGDGFDVVRQMRESPTLRDTPVVALTASTGRHDVDAALIAGCDGFLAKPCRLELIVETASKYLSRSSAAGTSAS